MSPNEAQLRAALHEGEGESVNAGALISHAVGVRRERRRRVYLAAGAAVAVAGVGVGIAALTNVAGHDNSTASGANARADRAAHALSRPSAAAPPPTPVHGTASAAGGAAITPNMKKSSATEKGNVPPPSPAGPLSAPPGCPATVARLFLPGGGGSGQFGASEQLFTHRVAKIVVCGYPAKASASVRRVTLRGGDATAAAAALESAPTTYRAGTCPGAEPALSGKLELLATGPNGTRSRPVVVTVGCRTTATNGTAVRYLDSLPTRFLRLLRTGITESPVR